MPEQTVHASQFYKWNSPSSYPKVTNSKNFWLKNRRTSGSPTMNYIYLGDVDLMIKQLQTFFKSIPQYAGYDLVLVGKEEQVKTDLEHNSCVVNPDVVASRFVHLYGPHLHRYSQGRQQQINQVNAVCGKSTYPFNQTPLGVHTLGLLKRGPEAGKLRACGYGDIYWKGLRVYSYKGEGKCYKRCHRIRSRKGRAQCEYDCAH